MGCLLFFGIWLALVLFLGWVVDIGVRGIIIYPALTAVLLYVYGAAYQPWADNRQAGERKFAKAQEEARQSVVRQQQLFDELLSRLDQSAEQSRRNIRRIMGEDDEPPKDAMGGRT